MSHPPPPFLLLHRAVTRWKYSAESPSVATDSLFLSRPSPCEFFFSSFDLGAGRRSKYTPGTGVVSLITRSLLIVFNFQPLSRWPSTHPVCPVAYVVPPVSLTRLARTCSASEMNRSLNRSRYVFRPEPIIHSRTYSRAVLHHTSFLEHLVGTSYQEILSKSYTFKFKPR